MISKEQLENWFTHHPPESIEDIEAYQIIREAGLHFVKILVAHTPPSADQTAAVRMVREAVMTANSARACGGK